MRFLHAITYFGLLPCAAFPQAGAWSAPFELPLNAIHTSLLPTGKVLMWGRLHENDLPIVWDPSTQTYETILTPGVDLFCAGHTFLSDGSLLVAGGHVANDIGTKDLLSFDPVRSRWVRLPDMTYDRWYPGTVNLYKGSVLISAGSYTDVDSGKVLGRAVPEVYDPELGTVTTLPSGQSFEFKYYPNMYPLTDTKLMMHRPVLGYRRFNPFVPDSFWSGSDTFAFKFEQFSFVRHLPNRSLGISSIKESEFKLLGLFDADAKTWTRLPDSVGGRRDCDSTILANGTVLLTGGSAVFAEPDTCTNQAEIFDPATNTLTVDASATIPRCYHSSAVLMPDGSVLKVGSGAGGTSRNVRQKNGEFYYPPYYFSPTRPAITFAPEILSYGQTVSISLTSAKRLKSAALIRLGSATHGMNYSQFYVPIPLATNEPVTANSFKVPTSKGDLPPGPYMLVVINEENVPSVAKMVTLGTELGKPVLTSFVTTLGDISNVTNSGLIAADTDFATVRVPVNTKSLEVATGEFEFVSSRRYVSSFRLRVGSRWPMAGTVKAEVWNYYLGAYETLGTGTAGSNGSNSTVTNWFNRRMGGREYVDWDTKKVKIRLTFKNPSSTRTLSNAELDVLALYFNY